MARLTQGLPAPAFTLPDQDANPVSLADFAGRRVVVYFYPQTLTSCHIRLKLGCMSTRQKQRLALRYRRMSFDDSEEQLRRQAEDVGAICELHDYRTKPEWLFTDDDESGNEDTRYRQRKGERPGLAALDAVLAELTTQGHAVTVVAWVPSRLFRDAGHKEHYFRRWARCGDVQVHTKQGVWNPKDPRDRFVSTIVAGADQYYSDDVREKVVRAHDDRRASGLPATGWPGFGHIRACGCGPKGGRCASPKHDRWIASF